MTLTRKKIVIATVVWGQWYVDALLDCTLPSLLSPKNFPFLAGTCDLEHIILTRPQEQPRIEASLAVGRARRFMAVHVLPALPATIDPTVNVFNFHHAMAKLAYDRAKQQGAYVYNLHPDAIFADGAGQCWADLIGQGIKSIHWVFPRAVDTVIPALKARFTRSDGTLVVTPRELVALNLEYLHPLSAAYFADSPHFPDFHPEMVIWPVAREGWLLRTFAGEPRLFDPSRVELSHQQIVTGNLDNCTFIGDSDALYSMSIAPAGHNADWYKPAAKADSAQIGRWWLRFDATSNDLAASRQIRIHHGPMAEETWRGVEMRANLFVSRATAGREFFRIAHAAFAAECSWTAALLTMAGRTTAALCAFPKPLRTIVFGPADAAVAHLSIGDLLKPSGRSRLAKFLRSHVVVDERPDMTLAERIGQAGGVLSLRSLAGQDLTVAARPDGRLTVGRYKLGATQTRIGNHTFIPIDGVLDPELARAAA